MCVYVCVGLRVERVCGVCIYSVCVVCVCVEGGDVYGQLLRKPETKPTSMNRRAGPGSGTHHSRPGRFSVRLHGIIKSYCHE